MRFGWGMKTSLRYETQLLNRHNKRSQPTRRGERVIGSWLGRRAWRPVRESNPCRHREREAIYRNSKETEARSGISKRRRNSLIAGATITFLTLCFTSGPTVLNHVDVVWK